MDEDKRKCHQCCGIFPKSMNTWCRNTLNSNTEWFCCHGCHEAWEALVRHQGKPCTRHDGNSTWVDPRGVPKERFGLLSGWELTDQENKFWTDAYRTDRYVDDYTPAIAKLDLRLYAQRIMLLVHTISELRNKVKEQDAEIVRLTDKTLARKCSKCEDWHATTQEPQLTDGRWFCLECWHHIQNEM